jgi:shikimate kinase
MTPDRAGRASGPVALVGLMGSGKSTVGRLVAGSLHRAFVDTDDEIHRRTGHSVRELWEEGGEAAYRPLESEVTLAALGVDATVVGIPGGAILDRHVVAALRRPDVFVAWLDAPSEVLAQRVRSNHDRPLLGDDPLTVLSTQLAERGELLADLATQRVDATLPPPEAARTILDALAGRQPRGA